MNDTIFIRLFYGWITVLDKQNPLMLVRANSWRVVGAGVKLNEEQWVSNNVIFHK